MHTQNTPLVIFRMLAHNSEATITRAMDSVLNQTYANLELHVTIRASTDSTADIADGHASKDPRVRVIINKQAFEYDEGNDIKDYYHGYDINNTYVCFIDGDDEYKPDFLEKMIPFAEGNNLDIAACGCDIVDSETGETRETRSVNDILLVEGEKFDTDFQIYHKYMRPRWAKLIKLSVTAKLGRDRIFWVYYCDDAIEMLEYLRNSERIGIHPGSFYKWYYYGNSLSRIWDSRRIESDRTIYELTRQFLLDKTGCVSERNNNYLLCSAYLGSVKETMDVLLGAPPAASEKLTCLHDIYTHKHTREAISLLSSIGSTSAARALIGNTTGWIAENESELYDAECMKKITDILGVIEMLALRL